MPYPPSLADAIGKELDVDRTGRLVDVGCGPGSLTLLLASLFEAAVGVDADHDMIIEPRRRAREAKATNIEWRHLRRGSAGRPGHVPGSHVRPVVPLDGSAPRGPSRP